MKPPGSELEVLGSLDGHQIGPDSLDNATRRILYDLDLALYREKKKAFEMEIHNRILEHEAKRRGLSVQELLNHEVYAPVAKEIEFERKSFLEGEEPRELQNVVEQELGSASLPLPKETQDSLSTGVVQDILFSYLKKRREKEALETYIKQLKSDFDVRIFLKEPSPLRQKVSIQSSPVEGPKDASITVVQFGAYGDELTAKLSQDWEKVKKEYGNKIQFAFRHFPIEKLEKLPKPLQKAHHVSFCAFRQNKFWGVHKEFLKNWDQLESPNMAEILKKAGLDQNILEKCMNEQPLDKLMEEDFQAVQDLLLKRPPVFFVNGIQVLGLDGAHQIRDVIEQETRNVYFSSIQDQKSMQKEKNL